MNENNRISEGLKAVVELTTRVDERVLHLIKHEQALEDKFNDHVDDFFKLVNQVTLLESRLEDILDSSRSVQDIELRLRTIESSKNIQEDRWRTFAGFFIQLVWVVLASFLLYKLGIQSPGVP